MSGAERIKSLLDSGGAVAIGELATETGLDRKTVQYHIQKMERDGSVRRLRWGRQVLVHTACVSAEDAMTRRFTTLPEGRVILGHLTRRPASRADLSRSTNLSWDRVQSLLNALVEFDLAQPAHAQGRQYVAAPKAWSLMRPLQPPPE